MGTCQRVRFPKNKVCAGDLKHPISIIDRAITPDAEGYKMDFTNGVQTRAAIKTKTDIVNFDGTNTKTQITHDFYVRSYNIVQNKFTILYDNKYFSVIGDGKIDETSQFLRITTTETGTINNKANY